MVNKIYEFINRIYYLIKLNILWLLFTLAGGVVLGIVPATIALFSCIRKQIRDQEEAHLFQQYKQFFSENFRRSILFSFVMMGLVFVLISETGLLSNGSIQSNLLLEVSIKVTRLVILAGMVMFFPVFVHFDVHGIKTFTQPFLFLFICPVQTVAIVLILLVVEFLYTMSPALVFFIGISLPAYGISLVMLKKFKHIEENILSTISS